MGGPKQLIDVGGRPMLVAVIEQAISGGVDGLVVVTRTSLPAELGLDDRADLHLAVNDDPESEMIDSILLGLDRVWSAYAAAPEEGILVLPGDCAEVGAEAVRAVSEYYRGRPGILVVAARQGKRGHPLVFPFGLAGEVRELAGTGGLNQLPDRHADRLVEVECGQAGVTRDVDTPEDYRRLGGR
jgi:molybdenum cofactor cytidylyltransferase